MKFLPKRLAALAQSSFFKGSFTYLSGSALNSVLPLFIIPILTRHLSPTDYGIMGTAVPLTQIFVVIVGVNAFGLIARSHFDDNPTHLRALLSTGMVLSGLLALVLLAVALAFGWPPESLTKFPSAWLPAVIALALGTVIQTGYLSLLQARSEPGRYIVIQTVGSVGNLLLSLFLVVHWDMDWRGRMWALLATQAIVAALCLRGLIFRLHLLRPMFQRSAFRELMDFGVPLIPHALGGWVMTMAARLFLNNLATLGDTGLYSLAYNLTSPLGMAIGAAQNAYFPALCRKLSSPQPLDKLRLCRQLLAAAFALPVLALLAAAGLRWLLPLIVARSFYGAGQYLTWMALTYAALGIYGIFSTFVVYSKKTSLMTWRADFLGGVVLVIACPLLIPWLGPIGAAQATFLGGCASAIGAITASRVAYPMPWGEALASFFQPRKAHP